MAEGLLISTGPLSAAGQMAADEALCEALPAPFILRFYDWSSPGVTFGYSQRRRQVTEALAAAGKGGLQAVRRPTGGGIVIHEDDLTFSLIFPSPEICFEPAAAYGRLHRAIAGAYAAAGEEFTLLSERTPSYAVNDPVMDCFSKPVNLDILYNGRKVLGGALRKFGSRMLYQASFQAPEARAAAARHRKLISSALAGEFSVSWREAEAEKTLLDRIRELSAAKYETDGWNARI